MSASSEIFCQTSDQASAAACAKANSWPAGPGQYSGEGSPEGNQIGFWKADIYMNTDNGVLYAFNGTPGEDTGWVAQVT